MTKLQINQISPESIKNIDVNDLLVLNDKTFILKPFDKLTISFLDSISKSILSNKSINYMPEIAALGFWLRKSNLNTLRNENINLIENTKYISAPLGKIFHICPANVDTMFFYSLTVSLLMGNKNILRISNRMEAQHVLTLFDLINSIVDREEYILFKNYIAIISYDHNNEISNFFSNVANARIIWGGDQTIKTFKQFTTAPRTKDIVFADRVSMLCVDCERYLNLNESESAKFMHLFYNDAYTFDQMGCSSPQTIYFVGNELMYADCRIKFQNDASNYLEKYYITDIASLASLKLNRMTDDAIENTIINQFGDNYIKLLELSDNIDESSLHGCGGGYFYIKNILHTEQLINLHNPKIQTICYWGLKENDFIQLKALANGEGIDRIVPLGEALNFHYIWDGYNLFDELSKKVYVK
jgi:hypothetical protein